MSKYNETVLGILTKTEIKSTNEILMELQEKSKKIINWHALYRILMELYAEGKVEKLKSRRIIESMIMKTCIPVNVLIHNKMEREKDYKLRLEYFVPIKGAVTYRNKTGGPLSDDSRIIWRDGVVMIYNFTLIGLLIGMVSGLEKLLGE